MIVKTSQTDIATIEKLPGNIFNVTIKTGSEVTVEAAKRLMHATNELMEDDSPFRGGVYDLSKITYVHAEAREYLSSGADIKGKVVGVALISTSYLGRIIANLFLTLTGSKAFPIQYFESPMRAEHWIRTKLREANNKANNDSKRVA
jgi:hypothetical protein